MSGHGCPGAKRPPSKSRVRAPILTAIFCAGTGCPLAFRLLAAGLTLLLFFAASSSAQSPVGPVVTPSPLPGSLPGVQQGQTDPEGQDPAEESPRIPTATQSIAPPQANGLGAVAPSSSVPGPQVSTPFRFESSNPDWPLTRASEACPLKTQLQSLSDHSGKTLLLSYELIRVNDGAVVANEKTDVRLDADGSSPLVPISSISPAVPGIYEIRCRLLEKPDRIWQRFSGDPTLITSIRMPWVVLPQSISAANTHLMPDGKDVSRQSDEAPFAKTLAWKASRPVTRFDPSAWQTPTWVPDAANRLVPSVGRMRGSIPIPTWRNESEPTSLLLAPGQSFVGTLSDLRPHTPHQITFEVSAPTLTSGHLKTKLEFSDSPQFTQITRTVRFASAPVATTASHSDARLSRQSLLHFPSHGQEFVRIVNESADQRIAMSDLTVSAIDPNSINGHPTTARRSAELRILADQLPDALASDFSRWRAKGYHPTTVALFRMWKAMERLPIHASWLGYDRALIVDPSSTRSLDDRVSEVSSAQWSMSEQDRVLKLIAAQSRVHIGWDHGSEQAEEQRAQAEESEPPFQIRDRSVSLNVSPSDHTSVLTSLQFPASLSTIPTRLRLQFTDFPMVASSEFMEGLSEYRSFPEDSQPAIRKKTGNSDYVRVLTGRQDRNKTNRVPYHLAIVNHAPWTSEVRLDLSAGAESCQRIRTEANRRKLPSEPIVEKQDADTWLVRMPPYGMVNLAFTGSPQPMRLASWKNEMAGGDAAMEQLKTQVGQIISRLGTLSLPEEYKVLPNGGFEASGKVGIVGWMHTQFPTTAVTLDEEEAIEGRRSIRLTTDKVSSGRTWLVSTPIPVPQSGRLAVSMALRAGADAAAESGRVISEAPSAPEKQLPMAGTPPNDEEGPLLVHRIRISLEGDQQGRPVRISKDFEIPCDGQWQPGRVLLEAESLDPDQIESVRLTIDSLSLGRLWIDDVRLHDRFATQVERTALQGAAFLAVQGLQNGELKPASDLLANHWASELLVRDIGSPPPGKTPDATAGENIAGNQMQPGAVNLPGAPAESPLPTAFPPSSLSPPSPSPATQTGPESVADRLRELLPRPIRF